MNFNYHIHAISIKCPYCDKNCHDDDYFVAQNLEERIEFECEHCEKKFFVESCIVYNTYSDCSLNGKDHKFKQSEYQPTVFDCENCHHTDVRSNSKEIK